MKLSRLRYAPVLGSTVSTRLTSRLGALLVLALLLPGLGGCLAATHATSSLGKAPPMHELLLEMAPLDLPANEHHDDMDQPQPLFATIPRDAWMHGFSVEIVDARGDTVPSAVLHHLKLMAPDKRDLFYPYMLRLVGAGSETREANLPHYVGFPVQAGDSLLLTAMVHNPTGQSYEGVRIRLRLRYSLAPRSPSPVMFYPYFAHVTPPGESSSYDLPPGRSEWSWEVQPAIAGYILGFGGHIHRYGVAIRFEDATTGKVLWSGRVRTDEEGNVIDIDRKLIVWGRGVYIHPDRRYRVTVIYDNPTGQTLVDEGMGTLGGAFRPAQPWPKVDRSDPLYVWDYDQEVSGASSRSHGHGHRHGQHNHHH